MSYESWVWVIALNAVALGVISIKYRVLFCRYCECVATLEGRRDEFYAIKSDDSAMTWFELEQAGKIWLRDYLKFNNRLLTNLGSRLFKLAIAGLVVAALLVLVVMVLYVGHHGQLSYLVQD